MRSFHITDSVQLIRNDDSWRDMQNLIACLHPIATDKLKHGKQHLARVFQSLLVCFDILSCISTEMEPAFALKFRDQFKGKESVLCVEEIIGCEGQVLECIMDVAVLSYWKQQETTKGSISLIELAKRALPLERNIESVRKSIRQRIEGSSNLEYATNHGLVVTNIYACAASVYFHTTISGARTDVPEIKLGVADTIAAIKLVPDAAIIGRLTWPVCVAACLAGGDHKDFFEILDRGLMEHDGKSHNILAALNVAKECWKLQRHCASGGGTYTWAEAMENLGVKVPMLF